MLRVALAVHQICYLPLVFASLVSIERCKQGWEQKAADWERRETHALAQSMYPQLCAKCFAQPPASHPLIPYRLFHPAQQKCVTARRMCPESDRPSSLLFINRQSDARNARLQHYDWVSWDAQIINNYFFSAEVAPRIKRCELRH